MRESYPDVQKDEAMMGVHSRLSGELWAARDCSSKSKTARVTSVDEGYIDLGVNKTAFSVQTMCKVSRK